jgi:FtsP/CotA-like multicopper oxidase with cupredoxin domain
LLQFADMILQPIDYLVYAWLILALLSALYVGIDQFRHNPEATVMKWGFVLVTLYMGPLGLLLYVLADKEPSPGTHEAFVAPLWKQAVGSTVHCVAGDATGIILAAILTALVGLPMWADLLVEYTAGFLFGLLIFQSLFMRAIMGGTYLENVRRSFIPELLSMNMMMAGMAPVMTRLMMGRDMRAMWPGEPLFWFVMSLGVTAGFILAYPINVWLVAQKMKHGLMTVREGAPESSGGMAHAAMQHSSSGQAGMQHSEMQNPDGNTTAMAHSGMEHPESQHAGAHSPDAAASASAPASISSESGHSNHSGSRASVTRAQLTAITACTFIALVAGMYAPATTLNFRLSAEDVRSAIMPPGMISTPDTPADAMRDMAAADPRSVTYEAPASARGDQPLAPRIENGVKVFDLDASVITWNILSWKQVTAYAINRQVPGPRLDLNEGDHVRINFTNHLPEPATMHWHGLVVPNAMDGPAHITQAPVPPGGHFTYEYVVQQSGSYFYHSHSKPDRQQAFGLYGALIIHPRDPATEEKADVDYVVQLQEWLNRDGLTYPAMLMEGGLPNYFTINGKAYPATETIHLRVGQRVKFRIIGTNNNFIHPMHMHGGPFTVVARDGVTLSTAARFDADVINVGPGQRYDVIWPARVAGKWIFHCHIAHHTLNNNTEEQGGGGLTLLVDVSP